MSRWYQRRKSSCATHPGVKIWILPTESKCPHYHKWVKNTILHGGGECWDSSLYITRIHEEHPRSSYSTQQSFACSATCRLSSTAPWESSCSLEGLPVLLSGLADLVLSKTELEALDHHHKTKLYTRTPAPVVLFLAGSPLATATASALSSGDGGQAGSRFHPTKIWPPYLSFSSTDLLIVFLSMVCASLPCDPAVLTS